MNSSGPTWIFAGALAKLNSPDMKVDNSNQNRLVWAWRLSLVVALGGALWSALGTANCNACRDAASILGASGLAWLGVAFYGTLTSLAFLGRSPHRLATWMTFGAAGAHVVLLTLLVKTGLFCAPCVLTGAAALLAAVARLAERDFRPALDAWPLPLAAMMVLGLAIHTQSERSREYKIAGDRLLASVRQEGISTVQGRIFMIYYHRPGCRHCEEFEHCLPKLEQSLGAKLTVEKRIAPADLPTPTIILLGRSARCMVGSQPCRNYTAACMQVLQESINDRTSQNWTAARAF
jgi:hypothetical protein